MIVLDEQLIRPQIIDGFARWYKGKVTTIPLLRPATRILDDAVPTVLRTVRNPTFVTINYADFWKVIPASPDYCVICLKLLQTEALMAPQVVRDVLRLTQFRAKRARMGKVISVRGRLIEFYGMH
jgi:hypothetical protein